MQTSVTRLRQIDRAQLKNALLIDILREIHRNYLNLYKTIPDNQKILANICVVVEEIFLSCACTMAHGKAIAGTAA